VGEDWSPKGARRFWAVSLAPGAAWLLVFFLVPVGLILAMSFGTTDIVGRPVYGWNPENYRQVLQPIFIPMLARSIGYALVVTVLCFAAGLPVAYTIAIYGGRYRTAIVLLFVLPWLVDYLVRIYAWVQLLSGSGLIVRILEAVGFQFDRGFQLIGNPGAVLVGLTYHNLPLMILPLFVAVDQLDRNLIFAAQDLNANPRQAFRRVTIPSILPGILAGAFLVFLSTVGDFANADLLGGPNDTMIGNLIQLEFAGGASLPIGAGLTAVLMGLMLVIIAFYLWASAASIRRLE
jgi:spermidine/putrescine transport system permease protein